jgi:hypothetical protein
MKTMMAVLVAFSMGAPAYAYKLGEAYHLPDGSKVRPILGSKFDGSRPAGAPKSAFKRPDGSWVVPVKGSVFGRKR